MAHCDDCKHIGTDVCGVCTVSPEPKGDPCGNCQGFCTGCPYYKDGGEG